MGFESRRPDEIVTRLLQVAALVGQGIAWIDAIGQIGITEQPYYRWRKQCGGIGTNQLKELKVLQKDNERFNGTLRREVLNAEWFHSTKQAQVAINAWLRKYNRVRPHHALNMRPPVPETLLEKPQITGTEIGG